MTILTILAVWFGASLAVFAVIWPMLVVAKRADEASERLRRKIARERDAA